MNTNPQTYTFAFYNIENLFDTIDDKTTNDDDFLPTADKRWTTNRYHKKLKKLGKVISKIGLDTEQDNPPILVGLAEVENKRVLNDLVNTKNLVDEKYSYVHFDSADERGIDVALLYKKEYFKVEHSETFSVYLENGKGRQDYTRDILLVSGSIHDELIHVIVNHWSSRREGENESEFKRIAASEKVNEIIENIKANNAEAKVIVMGDFNDNPNNNSVKLLEKESQLFNPFKTVWSHDKGSQNYNQKWNLFDQILFSINFFDRTNSVLAFDKADVFNSKFLTNYEGKYKGQPFRTYVGKKYKDGYSDHFPVYVKFKYS